MNKWPSTDQAKDLWEEYATIRAEDKRKGLGIERATKFYKSHQAAMDADSEVAWPERFDARAGEISALQHAYNLRFSRPLTFDAEYQNKPRPPQTDVAILPIEDIERKCSGYARGVLNPILDLVTAFIDVQGELLYYLVLGSSRAPSRRRYSSTAAGRSKSASTSRCETWASLSLACLSGHRPGRQIAEGPVGPGQHAFHAQVLDARWTDLAQD